MSDCLVLCGAYLNALADGTLAASSSSSAFAVGNLVDRISGSQHVFNAAAADDYHKCDLNQVTNGGFENATFDQYWSDGDVGSGNTCIEEASSPIKAGSKSMELTLTTAGAGNKASRYKDIIVPAGQYRSFMVSLYGDGTITTKCKVKILELGYTLQSNGTWDTTGAANVAEQSTGAWLDRAVSSYQIPAISTSGRAYLTMRIEIFLEDAATPGAGWADECYDWPNWNFAAMIGTRNFGPVTWQLRRSTDDFSASDVLVASPTIYRPTCWHKESSLVTSRYVMSKYPGTNHEALRLGELIIGQALTLTRKPLNGMSVGYHWEQASAGDGSPWVSSLSDETRRILKMAFTWYGTEWDQFRDYVLLMSEQGRWPIVVVPITTEPDVVYGSFDVSKFESTRAFEGVRRSTNLVVSEMALPSWLPFA